MIASGSKRDHLRRAREILATSESEDLRYAALELRLCLEAMTYEKLRSFEKHLSNAFLARTWQPPQLLKAMKQFDPDADKSFQLYAGVEAIPGVPAKPENLQFVGEHKAFDLAWLTKHYNKLGSFLHLQSKSASTDESKRRVDLAAIAGEIEHAQSGSILGSWMGEISQFECQLCKEQITVSRHYIETEHRAICLNPACEAEYIAEVNGQTTSFLLRASDFPCTNCGEQIIIETRHFASGLKVRCSACKLEHLIQCNWTYSAVSEPTVGAPANG